MNSQYTELAKICKSVYSGPVNQRLLYMNGLPLTFQKIVHGTLGRGFCRLFWNAESVVIAFRGTREIVDWFIANLICLPVALRHGPENVKVHMGFQLALHYKDKSTGLLCTEALYSHLKDNQLLDGKRSLYITGHSLGASLATLFTTRFRNDFPIAANDLLRLVVLFGSPSTGLQSFESFYGTLHHKTINIINGMDIVPSTPPFFFKHIGQKVSLRSGSLPIGNEADYFGIRDFLDRIKSLFKDHQIASYIRALHFEMTMEASSLPKKNINHR